MFKWLCILIGYLVVSSALMGFFVLEKENEQFNTLSSIDYRGNLIKLDGSIPLDMFIDTEYSTDNLRYVTYNNENVLELSSYYGVFGNFDEYKNTVYLKGIEPDNNGAYNVAYHITNTENGDISIIIASTNLGLLPRAIKANLINLDSNPTLQITYDYDELIFNVITTPIYTTNINGIWHNSGENVISTILNTNTGRLSIQINGVIVCNELPVSITDIFTIYGGIRLLEPNSVYITEIESEVYLTSDNENTGNLLKIIAQILTWTVDEQYLPTILNLMFIKFPMICLGIAIALYIRGVS